MKKQAQCDAVGVVGSLLEEGVRSGASDIHFEPTSGGLVIRFRLDGTLKTMDTLPKSAGDSVISRLKVLGGLLTYRNDIPQEGRIEKAGGWAAGPGGVVTDMRLAVFPTIYGQRAVVRLFFENAGLMELDTLGLNSAIEESLKAFAAGNQGVLLLTGPAGSGKSTTLGALLRYILRICPGKSIVALEDPVERGIEGITQVQIEPHGELTFPVALRSLLRQDPEVLMLGEIRDAETAQLAVEAGLTGHLLMSTLHSGSCSGALLRLLEMGIEPYQVTSAIAAIVNQRLVRRLCEVCKRPGAVSGAFDAVGGERGLGTGYAGRMLLAERVELDGPLRKAILQRADLETLDTLLAQRGHMNLAQDGRRLIGQGLTTDAELRRVCGG